MPRILIIADVHANLAALDEVLTAAAPFDELWNLGDTVGYGPDPLAVCERLAALGPTVWLAGNHDLAATGELPLELFNAAAAAAAEWSGENLPREWHDRLRGYPTTAVVHGVTFAHGSLRDPIWEYVLTPVAALTCLSASTTPLVFVGHSHVALRASVEGNGPYVSLLPAEDGLTLSVDRDRWLVNPGSVGQPRDGDPRAAFAVLDWEPRELTFFRVPYDIARTQSAMRAVRLPAPLIARLEFGR